MTAEPIDWAILPGPVTPNGKPAFVPVSSLVAAAKRITNKDVTRKGFGSTGKNATVNSWQRDAFDLTKLVGEQRFLTTTLAGRVGAARLYAGKLNDDPTEKPDPIDDKEDKAYRIFEGFGDTPAHRGQMLARQSLNLQVPGDGWFVGIPSAVLEGKEALDAPELGGDDGAAIDVEDLHWRQLSISEVKFDGEGDTAEVELKIAGKKIKTRPSSVWMIRCWNPDFEHFERASSPAQSSLPVLRELVGLTMHVSAQVDSRLAGAGVFLVPQEAKDAILAAMPDDYEGDDPFTDALIEAMMTAISDRSNASALVPLVMAVPGVTVEQFKWMSFSTPLDKEARALREEAIRRLALGQDIPPEVLLGVGGMNHWGAWLVREDTITTHVEPQLALICDALTTQYLWPVLVQQGMDEEEAHKYVIWYDVDHLITRPNRLDDAIKLHQEGAISDSALRDAGGFTDNDSPVDVTAASDAANLVLKMVQANASLIRNPGIPALLEGIGALLKGGAPPEAQPGTEIAVPQDEVIDGELVDSPASGPPQEQSPIMASGLTPELAALIASIVTDSRPDAQPVEVNITLDVPESKPPIVNVNVPDGPAPIVNVENKVNPTPVTVEGPVVNVPQAKPPVINVPKQAAPVVNVTTPKQAAPVVNVAVPDQKAPVVNVEAPKPRRRRSKVIRDKRTGLITEVETQE